MLPQLRDRGKSKRYAIHSSKPSRQFRREGGHQSPRCIIAVVCVRIVRFAQQAALKDCLAECVREGQKAPPVLVRRFRNPQISGSITATFMDHCLRIAGIRRDELYQMILGLVRVIDTIAILPGFPGRTPCRSRAPFAPYPVQGTPVVVDLRERGRVRVQVRSRRRHGRLTGIAAVTVYPDGKIRPGRTAGGIIGAKPDHVSADRPGADPGAFHDRFLRPAKAVIVADRLVE